MAVRDLVGTPTRLPRPGPSRPKASLKAALRTVDTAALMSRGARASQRGSCSPKGESWWSPTDQQASCKSSDGRMIRSDATA